MVPGGWVLTASYYLRTSTTAAACDPHRARNSDRRAIRRFYFRTIAETPCVP